MMFFFLLASICPFFSLISALPVVSPVIREVWTPPVIYPNSNTVWVAGGSYTVAWNTSGGEPPDATPVANLYLRQVNNSQSTTLAQDFLLITGEISVTVPVDTPPATDWVVVLFGDSGDWSHPFTILAPSSCPS